MLVAAPLLLLATALITPTLALLEVRSRSAVKYLG